MHFTLASDSSSNGGKDELLPRRVLPPVGVVPDWAVLPVGAQLWDGPFLSILFGSESTNSLEVKDPSLN